MNLQKNNLKRDTRMWKTEVGIYFTNPYNPNSTFKPRLPTKFHISAHFGVGGGKGNTKHTYKVKALNCGQRNQIEL